MRNLFAFSLMFFLFGFSAILFADDCKESEHQNNTAVKSEKKSEKHHQLTKQEEKKKSEEPSIGFNKKQAESTEAVCPVTKEKFKITKDTTYSEYKGKYYYFCCEGCKPHFDKEPEKYIR